MESVNRLQQAAGCEARDLIGTGREAGVGVELGAGPSFGVRYGLDVERVVDEGEFAFGGQTRRDERERGEFFLDEVMDDAQAVGALGVAGAGIVLQITVVFDDGKG